MDVLLTLPFVFFVLLFLWLGFREVRKALTEIRTIARLKQSGVLQQGTIMKIEMKRYPPTTYGKVVFQYKENKTTYLGKHLMMSRPIDSRADLELATLVQRTPKNNIA
jgi:hypothetical protein